MSRQLALLVTAIVFSAGSATAQIPVAKDVTPGSGGTAAPMQAALEMIRADNAWTLQQQRELCEIPAPPFQEAARGAVRASCRAVRRLRGRAGRILHGRVRDPLRRDVDLRAGAPSGSQGVLARTDAVAPGRHVDAGRSQVGQEVPPRPRRVGEPVEEQHERAGARLDVVQRRAADPGPADGEWDGIAEGSFAAPSGRLRLRSLTGEPAGCPRC